MFNFSAKQIKTVNNNLKTNIMTTLLIIIAVSFIKKDSVSYFLFGGKKLTPKEF